MTVERQHFFHLVVEGPIAARPAVLSESEPAMVRRGMGIANRSRISGHIVHEQAGMTE